jgi:hypothetical protein
MYSDDCDLSSRRDAKILKLLPAQKLGRRFLALNNLLSDLHAGECHSTVW